MKNNSHFTTDHEKIRKWAELRGGAPACVEPCQKRAHDLLIDFGEHAEESLAELTWDEFFNIFEENHLGFLYQDETTHGERSYFFKFIERNQDTSNA
jgi:hypothetical protein